MMSSDKKSKSLEELWDRIPKKLLVYVVEGVSLVTKSGAGNPYVKVFVEKQKFKTQSLKHNEDPTWKELFLFEFEQAPAPGSMVNIEVYNKQSIGSDKLIGQAKVAIPLATPEECHDVWIDLELPPNMKEKNKELLDGKLGNIHLRLLYSNAKETPPAAPGNNQICDYFITKDIKRRMKSGDILLYSGIGPLDSVIKTLTNTRYSRAALVFRAPNKWTEKDQLYLFEVTRNVGGFPDAFNEKCAPGANFFKLEERLHMIHAKTVWWAPLKDRLDPESGAPNMIDWLFELHDGRQSLNDFLAPLPAELLTLYSSQFELNVNKAPFASAELNGTQYLINALRLGGRRLPFGGAKEFVAPVALLGMNFFDEPVLLRSRRQNVEPAVLDKILTGPTVTNEREALAAIAASGAQPSAQASAAPAGAPHRMTIYGGVSPYNPSGSTTGPSNGSSGNAFEQSSGDFAPPQVRKESGHPAQNTEPAAQPQAQPQPVAQPVAQPILPPIASEIQSSPRGGSQPPPVAPKPQKSADGTGETSDSAASSGKSSSMRKTTTKKSKKTLTVTPAPADVPDSAPPPYTPPAETKPAPAPAAVDIPPPMSQIPIPEPLPAEVAAPALATPPATLPKPKKKKDETSSKRERKATHDKPKKVLKKPESSSNRLSRKIDGGLLANKMEERANTAKIIFDFEAENEGELSCRKGDIVRVLDEVSDPDWALVRKEGSSEFGCVPKTFLKNVTNE